MTAKRHPTALIGTGWWGMNVLRCAMEAGESKVVALCDVDENQLNPAASEVTRLSGDKPKKYKDFRELLHEQQPEIVIVATPDHWHALITIAALEAGAHVWVEKPIGHTIKEGHAMLKAARSAGRMVQVDLHRRVSPHHKSGMAFLKSGRAGHIGMVKAFLQYAKGLDPQDPESDPPPGLDWNMWCGPAPLRPFRKAIHPKGFRQFLDYSNGSLGNWAIHWLDQILWWTEEKYPRKVYSTGGRHVNQDCTDAPDTQTVSYEFDSFTALWEHRHYAYSAAAEKSHMGCYFYGSEGTFHMGWRDGWTFYPIDPNQPILHEDACLQQPGDQNIRELWADFLESVKTGKQPLCELEIGHRSTVMTLLGIVSLKLGRSVEWDPEKEEIVSDLEGNKLLSRTYRAPWVYPEG